MNKIHDMLIDEVKSLAKIAKDLTTKIEGAKTRTKSNYYHKKLKENNELATKCLIALNRLNSSKNRSNGNEVEPNNTA